MKKLMILAVQTAAPEPATVQKPSGRDEQREQLFGR